MLSVINSSKPEQVLFPSHQLIMQNGRKYIVERIWSLEILCSCGCTGKEEVWIFLYVFELIAIEWLYTHKNYCILKRRQKKSEN